MKKGLIISLLLIISGGLIFVCLVGPYGFDFNKMTEAKTVVKTYEINDSFNDIKIDVSSEDIRILKSESGKAYAESRETEKITFSVEVDNNLLKITRVDNRRFFERLFSFNSTSVTLYLPEEIYGKLEIDVGSGNVAVASGFTFSAVDVRGSSSDIRLLSSVSGNCFIKTSSGDVEIMNASLGSADIEVSSGDITLKSLSVFGNITASLSSGEFEGDGLLVAGELGVDLSSGDVSISDTVCHIENNDITSSVALIGAIRIDAHSGDVELEGCRADNLYIETSSGEVEFLMCDSPNIDIKTSSGDVEGTLLTGKMFDAKASSGSVRVPDDTVGGGICKIRTSSGDIEISVAN